MSIPNNIPVQSKKINFYHGSSKSTTIYVWATRSYNRVTGDKTVWNWSTQGATGKESTEELAVQSARTYIIDNFKKGDR